jgi:hypothetical protein
MALWAACSRITKITLTAQQSLPAQFMHANEQICTLTGKSSVYVVSVVWQSLTTKAATDSTTKATNKFHNLRTNSTTSESLTSTMAGTTTTPSGPTHIVESYHAVESRITQAIEILQGRGGQPNFAAAAREFLLPVQRLRARWNGRPSKIQTIPGNRRLSKHQELAVCQYLDRLDNIGLPAP